MGMLGHAVEVMIVKKEGEPLILDFWLDNEAYLDLTKNPDIFDNVKNTKALLEQLPLGFIHPSAQEEYEDDEDYGYKDTREFLTCYDYMDVYANFEKDAKKIALNSIDSVVLMSVINHEYGQHRYTFDWVKYQLSPKKVTTGSGVCDGPYDVGARLKELICAQGTTLEQSISKVAYAAEPDEDDDFDMKAFEQKMRENGERWMRTYGSAVEKHPVISIYGKSFVLSGMEALGDEYEIDIEEAITEKGGVVRKSVSGKTDYLIVDPQWAGESKVKEAIEQQKKGSSVKIILGTDFMAVL